MNYKQRKRMYIIGSSIMVVVIAAIIFAVAFASCGSGKYDKYYEQAEDAFLAGDYQQALASLEKAMDIEHTEECYLLMAEVYYAQDDIDMAIQVLYLGYTRVGGSTIDTRLQELKAIKNGGSTSGGDTVTIAGTEYQKSSVTLVLSDRGLTDSDVLCLSDMTLLESLSLSGNSIRDISALSGLSSLTFLQISDNQISDLKPLSSLIRLKTLYIDGNPIEDFTPLYSLTSLKTLSMKNITISQDELDSLKEALPNCSIYCDETTEDVVEITLGGKTFRSDVTELSLGGLEIDDISALSRCRELVKLDLRDNRISDISALVDLQELEWLCLWNNRIEDLRPLMSLTKLTYLDLDSNNVTDISPLSYLVDIEELWLSGNELSSISPIAGLNSLRRLGLKDTGLNDDDLDIVAGLIGLTELTIENNEALSANKVEELKAALPDCAIACSKLLYVVKLGTLEFKSDATEISAVSGGISDLSGLEKFTALKSLLLTNNSITDISPLKELKELEELSLYGNRVSDISPLTGHSALKSLDLMNNNLTDVSALASCTGLTTLHLSYNSIEKVDALAACTALTELSLDANLVESISALASLRELRQLSLENNFISDLSPLYALTKLEKLYIRGNNLDAEDIIALQQALPDCLIITDVELTPTDTD